MTLQAFINALPARYAVVSPGSRNAPIIRNLLASKFTCHSVVDERSAAFQALGMAQALKEPIVLSCTSGTAALNYYPAIAEAYYARIPLIVLTADRPSEAIDQWDGQAIRQDNVFDAHARLSINFDSENDEMELERMSYVIEDFFSHAIPGPIHVNIPLEEPLYNNEPESIEPQRNPISIQSTSLNLEALLDTEEQLQNVMLFSGLREMTDVSMKPTAGLVTLADVCSGKSSNIELWDAYLFNNANCEELKPDILITTGTSTVSKGLKQFLRKFPPSKHYHISHHNEVGNMFHTSPIWIKAKDLEESSIKINPNPEYLSRWRDAVARYKVEFNALDWKTFHEFGAFKQVINAIPEGSKVHLGNSMPVRFASYLSDFANGLDFYGNRGTSGIDGATSTAVGYALITDQPVYLVVGDLAFLYDINGLWQDQLPANLKIVVSNNQGGRIFELLEGPSKYPEALSLQVTPQQRSIKEIAQHFHLKYFCAENFGELNTGLRALQESNLAALLEIKTEPETNQKFYRTFKQNKL